MMGIPTIRFGRRAGQPVPLNDLMLDRITAAKRAVVELRREGHTVLHVDIDATSTWPTITVEYSSLCKRLLETGEAAYVCSSAGALAGREHGKFARGDCSVVWER